MIAKTLLISAIMLCCGSALAQMNKNIHVQFQANYGSIQLQSDSPYQLVQSNDSIKIDVLKFYISGIELMQDGHSVWKEPTSFHLVDVFREAATSIMMQVPATLNYTQLQFNLGIDSAINSEGVRGGDLDPSRGMYWTWQSGYINVKLEGNSNVCKTRQQRFQFHLGGYHYPDQTIQKINLNVNEGKVLLVNFDLEQFFKSIDLSNSNQIMSPGKEAHDLAIKLAKCIKTQ